VHETLEFNPEWVVDRIAPRPVLFITTDDDILKGYGHYQVYAEPAFGEVMRVTTAWFRQYLPA